MRINWKHPVILTLIIGVPVSHFGVSGYRYFTSKGETESDSQDKKLQQLYEEKLKMPKAPKTKLGKVRTDKVIHPNSRKAAYLAGQVNRNERVQMSKQASSLKLEVLAEKLLWFKERLDPEKKVFPKSDFGSLVQEYLQRFDSELEQIDIVRSVGKRQGNPHSSRENAVKLTIEREKRQIAEGSFEVPHVFNAKNLAFFRAWNGEIKYVKNIKLSKISSKDLEKGSTEGFSDENEEMEDEEEEKPESAT